MSQRLIRFAAVAGLALLPACNEMSTSEGMIVGAALGYVTAQALEADHDWTIVAVLAGAAVGTLVARNSKTNRCAYARSNGRYYVEPCPRPRRR